MIRHWDLRLVLHRYAVHLQEEARSWFALERQAWATLAPYIPKGKKHDPPVRPAILDWAL